jgi:hypothetical protein
MSNKMRKYIDSFRNFIIKENSSPDYDEILDLYNQFGLEGMSKDEIDFLKSGGQTKLPNRFKTRELLGKHKETTKSHEGWQKSIAGQASSLSGGEVKPIISTKNEKSKIVIQKLKKFLRDNPEWEIDYPFEGIGWGLGTLFQILFKDDKLFDELVKTMYDDKQETNTDKELISPVYIRGEKDWSKKYNNHRKSEEIPGSEYKIALTIPKNWFEDLFSEHF